MSHLRTPRAKNGHAAVHLRLESLEDRSVPAPFTAGNVVVYRVGDGAAMTSGAATAVFLDEYTPTGALVQSVGLPTADNGSNQQLTSSSTATTEGFLTLSTDGRFLIIPGYDAAPGTASVSSSASATIARVIGRVGAGGAIDTSTTTTSFSGVSIRGATSTNGTDLWASGANTGLVYTTRGATSAGTVVSTTLTNLRAVSIFDGQLYISTQSGSSIRIGSVGTGTPTTTGQSTTNIPGGPTSGAFNGFFFADLSSSVAGVDTLYVADESDFTIQKYALVSGSWTARGTIAATSILGLTGAVSGTTVTLFGTTGGSGASGGGTLYKFTDTTGYNANVSGTATSLVTAATNTAFRGVAFAPQVGAPTVTNATTNEDIQTASGLVISASDADDGTTHFKITGITNGTLFQNNGTTAIANGTFITKAEGAAGLKFTPALNQSGTNLGSFQVQASTNNLDSGLGGSVATTNITVNPVADTPSATIATTNENMQTTSGLVLTPNPVDSTEVTHYKITGITNGTLFQNNGTTAIANDTFITVAQGNAGLKFTPASNFFGIGSFDVQGAVGNTGTGLSIAATATIIVRPAAVAIYINEILEPPGFQSPNVYVEFRGAPNSTIPAGTYLIGIEGDAQDNRGDVQNIFNLSGFTFGSNGYLVLLMKNNTYAVDPAASTVTASGAGTGYEGLPGFSADSVNAVEFAAVSFLLVRSANAPTLTDDIDSDNDGTADGTVHAAWTHLDSVGVLDGGSQDRSYAALTFALNGIGTASGTVASVGFIARYVGRNGDSTGSAVVDWVAGGQTITGTAPNFTLAATNTSPIAFAGRALNHIGSTNFANGAPVNTVSGAQTVNEDAARVFSTANGNAITVADPDAGSSALRVTLTATNGALTLNGIAGLTFTTGDGSDDVTMTFTGSAAAINTALNGLSFTPTTNFTGIASLTLNTNDQGATGGGGALSDNDVVTIIVNAVNDEPTFTLASNLVTVPQGRGAFSQNGFAMFSTGGGADENTQTPTYNLTNTNNALFSSQPTVAAAGQLTFTPAPGASGTAAVTVNVTDSGSGTAPNDNTSQNQTFTITVNAAPVGPAAGEGFIVAGSDAGTLGVVRVLDAGTLAIRFNLLPYDGYLGGVCVAQGDVNSDGTNDIITATATNMGHVKVFDGVTGAEIRSFLPFGTFPSGLSVASGDTNGDGFADIVVGITNGTTHVQAFSGRTGELLQSFIAYDGFLGGVRVAVGDVDGDDRAEIAAVAGPGGSGHIKVFDGPSLTLLQSYISYDGYQGEINLAIGDVTGDGQDEVVTTALGAQGSTHVKAIGVGVLEVASFFAPTIDDVTVDVVGTRRAAVPSGATEPARVSAADVDGDGVAEILLGSAPGAGPSRLVLLRGASQTVLDHLFAFDSNFALGVYVG